MVEVVGGVTLLALACGIWQRLAVAWWWVLALLLVTALAATIAGAPVALRLYLVVVALLLTACRSAFDDRHGGAGRWKSPALVMLLAVTLASSVWLISRG